MRELILARHGESTASLEGIVDGEPGLAVDLTAEGEKQARALGETLRDRRVDVCATSEFLRTRRTADCALEGRTVPRLVIADLNDMRFGALQGAPIDSYRAWVVDHGLDATPRGGESRLATVARFVRALRALQGRREPSVLAITHGLTVAYVQAAVTGGDLDALPTPPPYATAHFFDADEIDHALDRLESWLRERIATCTSN